MSLIIHTECTGGDESINKCPAFLNSAVDACAQKGHTVALLFLWQPKKMRKKIVLASTDKIRVQINDVDAINLRLTAYSRFLCGSERPGGMLIE